MLHRQMYLSDIERYLNCVACLIIETCYSCSSTQRQGTHLHAQTQTQTLTHLLSPVQSRLPKASGPMGFKNSEVGMVLRTNLLTKFHTCALTFSPAISHTHLFTNVGSRGSSGNGHSFPKQIAELDGPKILFLAPDEIVFTSKQG